jgi:hypothetical protein
MKLPDESVTRCRKTSMNTSKTNQSFEFRHNIPVYRMPDRAKWENNKGVCPFCICRVRESYVRRALAAVAKDYATIDRDEAIAAEVKLESVCTTVQFACDLPYDYLVFFDPSEEQFWVFPPGVQDQAVK